MSEPPEKEAPAKAGTKAGRVNRTVEERKMPDGGPNVNPAEKTDWKPRARNIKAAEASGGWVWLEKEAIDRILLHTSNRTPGLIVAVYAALCRLASDRKNATEIQEGKAVFAKLAGVSTETVERALPELEAVGLIRVHRKKSGKLNEKNRYALLACRNGTEAKKGGVCETLRSESDSHPDPVLKEIEEKGGVENDRPCSAGAAQAVVSSPSEMGNAENPKPKKKRWGFPVE